MWFELGPWLEHSVFAAVCPASILHVIRLAGRNIKGAKTSGGGGTGTKRTTKAKDAKAKAKEPKRKSKAKVAKAGKAKAKAKSSKPAGDEA